MKASEIFVEYSSPIQNAVPANGVVSDLQAILKIPELAWNATVLDRSKNRKPGELPKILKERLSSLDPQERKKVRLLFEFWVGRKDKLFASYDWPIEVEVYKNLKKELVIRVFVLEPKHFVPNLPKEWLKPKPTAQTLQLDLFASLRK